MTEMTELLHDLEQVTNTEVFIDGTKIEAFPATNGGRFVFPT